MVCGSGSGKKVLNLPFLGDKHFQHRVSPKLCFWRPTSPFFPLPQPTDASASTYVSVRWSSRLVFLMFSFPHAHPPPSQACVGIPETHVWWKSFDSLPQPLPIFQARFREKHLAMLILLFAKMPSNPLPLPTPPCSSPSHFTIVCRLPLLQHTRNNFTAGLTRRRNVDSLFQGGSDPKVDQTVTQHPPWWLGGVRLLGQGVLAPG